MANYSIWERPISHLSPFESARFAQFSRRWSEATRGEIPLSAGEMDLPIASTIADAVREHLALPLNYPPTYQSASVTQRLGDHYRRELGIDIGQDQFWLVANSVSATTSIIRLWATNERRVAYLAPSYDAIPGAIAAAGAQSKAVPMLASGPDWDGLSEALSTSDGIYICNPHNPTGYDFTSDDLARIRALLERNNGFLLSNELHSRVRFGGRRTSVLEQPSRGLREFVVDGATKSFGLSAIGGSYVASHDKKLLDLVAAESRHAVPIATGIQRSAMEAAYGSDAWLSETLDVFARNRDELAAALASAGVTVHPSQSTYFLWIKTSAESTDLHLFLRDRGVVSSAGPEFGAPKNWARLCFATTRQIALEAARRIAAKPLLTV